MMFGFFLAQFAWYQKLGVTFSNPIRRYGASLLATLAAVMSLLLLLMIATSKSLTELQPFIGFSVCSFALTYFLKYRFNRKVRIPVLNLHRFSFRYRSDLAALVIPASITLFFSLWVTQTNGDQGWDSNAYHLPIAGLLLSEGSNNFHPSLGLGTYTILTPYGAHTLGSILSIISGTFIFSALVTWIAVFSFTCFAYGSILESKSLSKSERNKLIYFFPTAVWLIPSIAGQTTHFYVDAIAGVFVASTLILLFSFLSLETPAKLYTLLIGIMGSTA